MYPFHRIIHGGFMLRVPILPEDLATIQRDRYYHPQPHIMMRMHTLALHHGGLSAEQIAPLLDRDPRTIRTCLKTYRDGGLSAVYEYNKYKHECELDAFSELIESDFEKHPPQSINEASDRIEKLTGIKRSPTQISAFLKKKGFKCLKTGSIPSKADPVAQKEFLENTIEPIIAEAQAGECDLYFVDAAHFVLGAFLGYLWSKFRVFIRTPSGRQRYNILAAYNAITGTMATVTNTTYINSASVLELLSKLRQLHPGRPIKVILDNASYQKNYLVRWHAAILDIELVFLPSYSPNLNLIERYWKFVKKKCLYNRFHGNFESFCAAIDDCLKNGNEKYADELKTLMTLNFQSFENVQFLAV